MEPERWRRIEHLYHTAVELEESRRRSFLAEACSGDDELRREVESLLAQEKDVDNFLKGTALEAARIATPDEALPGGPEQAELHMESKVVSHYRVLAQLGSGGMGVVYKAQDMKLGRFVALKFLPKGFAQDRKAIERFQLEARAASALNHPHICTIHDIDEYNGQPFIVMELLAGQTLKQRIAGKPMKVQEVCQVGLQIADALEAAHNRGIVHRDIKPANIFLDDREQVKVLDFGLAKLLRPLQDTTLSESLTEAKAVVGTVPYMAPEQLRGENLDPRTDIYALGTVLYEMATCHRPFEAETTAALAAGIIHKPPPPPTRLNRDIPAKLEGVLLKCLEKEPASRYQSAKELAVDLRRLQSSVAGMESVAQTAPLTRKLRIAGLGAVCVLGILFTLNVGRWREHLSLRSTNPHIQSLAVLPLANLSHDPAQAYFSDGMTDELITELSKVGALRVISRTSAMHYLETSKTLPEIARELNVDAVVEGSVVRFGNQVKIGAKLVDARNDRQLWAESYQRELKDVLALQGEIARDIANQVRVKVSPKEETRLNAHRPVNAEAHEAYLKGLYYLFKFNTESEKSGHYFEEAIAKDPEYAPAYAGLSIYYTTQGAESSGSLPLMFKAEAAAQRALALDSELAEGHHALAAVHLYYSWDWATAEREIKLALELNPNLSETHNIYGDYFKVMGQYEQAVAEYTKAQKLDPLKPLMNADLAHALTVVQRYEEAIEAARKALEVDPDVSMAHYTIALAKEQQGDYRQAAAKWHDILVADNKKALATLVQKTYESSGYASMKQLMARKNIEAARRASPKHTSPVDIAGWYAQIGDNQHAFELLEQAYDQHLWPLPVVQSLPEFDRIRDDPRFQDLVRRIRAPH